MHSCKLMLLGQKSVCCKYQLVSEGSRCTRGSDPSPGLFPNIDKLVGKPWQCKTEDGNATFNSCDFELMFPPVPRDTASCQSKGLRFPCTAPSCCRRKALLSSLLYGSDNSDTLRQILQGGLKKSYGCLIWVSVPCLCFTNKLQVKYACSSLSFLS